jgi:predicted lipid-binding transport protein (Tim44 family)
MSVLRPSQVLSTRIYRGQAPEGCLDAGISFIAFGGAAVVQRCTVHEMGSAWEQAKASAAASAAASPQHAAAAPPSRGASAATSPSAAAATAAKAAGPPSPAAAVEADGAAAAAAAAAADALLDDLVTLAVSPQCTTQQMVGAFS